RALRTGSGRGAAVACQTQLGLSDRHRRPPSGEPILDIAATERNRLLNRLRPSGRGVRVRAVGEAIEAGVAGVRLTAAQALVRFLAEQHVERDGVEHPFFGGCFGIFGHGNVGGIGQALYERPDLLPYHQARSEQGMVHTAAGYARQKNRLGAFACTTSIGPGATNMVTGAALATVNRLPVLLLPGDVFASRRPDPVLQQLETPWAGDSTVNDAFRPVSKYFDR